MAFWIKSVVEFTFQTLPYHFPFLTIILILSNFQECFKHHTAMNDISDICKSNTSFWKNNPWKIWITNKKKKKSAERYKFCDIDWKNKHFFNKIKNFIELFAKKKSNAIAIYLIIWYINLMQQPFAMTHQRSLWPITHVATHFAMNSREQLQQMFPKSHTCLLHLFWSILIDNYSAASFLKYFNRQLYTMMTITMVI